MSTYHIGVQRPATRRDIEQRIELAVEAIEEHNPDALLAFAEHLIEEGLLGCGIEEVDLSLSVEQLVKQYAATTDGRAEAKAWAQQLAEHQAQDGFAA